MRGAVRLMLVFATLLAASLVLVPPLWLAVRTGWFAPGMFPPLWYRSVLWALGWRVAVKGGPAGARPLLIAANHVSWADILVFGAQGDLAFVAKSEVASWPLIGWLARLQDVVFVERELRRTSAEQAEAVARRLARHAPVVLFAEGTTSDGNLVLPFKSTLFGALKLMNGDAGRPITVQPASIAYTKLHGVPLGRWERNMASWIGDHRPLFLHLRLLAGHGPLDVALTFGEPLAVAEAPRRKDLARLTEASARRMMAEALR